MNHFVMNIVVIFGRKRYFFTDRTWISGNEDFYFSNELKHIMKTKKGPVFENKYRIILKIFKTLGKISNDEMFSGQVPWRKILRKYSIEKIITPKFKIRYDLSYPYGLDSFYDYELVSKINWKNLLDFPNSEYVIVHNLAKIFKTLEKRKDF